MSTVSTLSSGLTSGTAVSALTGAKTTTADTNLASALTGTKSSTAIADTTSTALQQISDQIAALGAQGTGNVQEFEKTTQDVLYDNNATGRAIGQLRLNTARLNVISALSPKDTVDVFTFNVSSAGPTKLNALINDPAAKDQKADASKDVHIQIFAKSKGIVADSDPNAGKSYQNYLALKNGKLDLSSGQYSIRVARAQGVDPQAKNTFNYALQLSQGTKYTQDYTVTEQGYTPGKDDPFGLGVSNNDPASILSGALSDAYSFISSLPSIGTSGTSKLLGFIYTTSA